MFFGRSENFRYAFGKPPETRMNFMDGPAQNVYGLLLDISPSGARIFVDNEIPECAGEVKLSFAIMHERIQADASIIWARQLADGWIYGLQLTPNAVREMFISGEVEALKQKK